MLNRLTHTTHRLRSDAFYRHVLMFTTASLVASVINYLFYPIMGRLIGVSNFGELQVITSFILQLTTVYVSLNLINVNVIANHEADEAPVLMAALQKSIFWLVLALCVVLAACSPLLRSYFHFTSVWPFLLIIPVLLIDTVSVFWTGFLQGHRDFFSLSAYSISTAMGKLLFAIIFVLLGLGVIGGVLGISVGLVFSLMLVRYTASRTLPRLSQAVLWPSQQELRLIRSHLVYIAEVLISLIAMSVLLSIDVILVKHFFSAQVAGRYAGVATIARIIFFASAPIVTVMLPTIKLMEQTRNRASFLRSLSLSLGICLVGFCLFGLFPMPILNLLLGHPFAVAAPWLPYVSVIAVLATLTNLMVNYLLALRSHWSIVISLLSLAVAIALIGWHHGSIYQIVFGASMGLLSGQVVFWVTFLQSPGLRDKRSPGR